MSEIGEVYADMRRYHKRLAKMYAVECPRCAAVRPKACPSRLLPGQRCKVDGYVDPRPLLTVEQKKECRL